MRILLQTLLLLFSFSAVANNSAHNISIINTATAKHKTLLKSIYSNEVDKITQQVARDKDDPKYLQKLDSVLQKAAGNIQRSKKVLGSYKLESIHLVNDRNIVFRYSSDLDDNDQAHAEAAMASGVFAYEVCRSNANRPYLRNDFIYINIFYDKDGNETSMVSTGIDSCSSMNL